MIVCLARRPLVPLALLAATAILGASAACGSDGASAPGADDAGSSEGDGSTGVVDTTKADPPDTGAPAMVKDDPVDPTYPAPHTPFPELTYNGGRVLRAPKIVTITFDGDPLRAQLEELGDTITQGDYWKQITAGYCDKTKACVGPGESGGHVHLSEPAPASLVDSSQGKASTVQEFLRQHIVSGALPPPDDQTIYAVYFPKATSVVLDGQRGCNTFGGYHNTLAWDPNAVVGDAGPLDAGSLGLPHDASAPVPPLDAGRLDPAPADGGLADAALGDGGLAGGGGHDGGASPNGTFNVAYSIVPRCGGDDAYTTLAASHEFAEAATDPDVGVHNKLAFYMQDQVFAASIGGGENGDLCVDPTGRGGDTWLLGNTTVQRTWSPASAAAGHDPCVPIPAGEVYFNAAPADGTSEIALAKGKSTTIEVDGFSDAPMEDWTVRAVDFGSFTGTGQKLEFSWDRTNVHNGSKRKLTIKLIDDLPNSYEFFAIVSSSTSRRSRHSWPGIVVQQ